MIVDFRGKKCPKCGRKGLHYANHPHAFGYKDYDRVACRFCQAYFTLKKKPPAEGTEGT